jgi:hypothetical protein
LRERGFHMSMTLALALPVDTFSFHRSWGQ